MASAPTLTSSSPSPSPSQQQTVDLSTVPTPQLTQLKNQLTQEVSQLTSSFTQLRGAQAKFRDCIASVRDGVASKKEGTPILVPLTPSLYVPGLLASTSTILVDVGTGFYVEKTPEAAREFYTRKVAEIGHNLQELETIVSTKQSNLRVVED
ncbi:subunit of tubulin prefoldin, partial [Sticta canariensis]|nr:subunit of tubulin prefoldin [Sticta canariensis]